MSNLNTDKLHLRVESAIYIAGVKLFKKLTQAESFGIFSIPLGVFVLALAMRVAYIFQIETSPLFAHPPSTASPT